MHIPLSLSIFPSFPLPFLLLSLLLLFLLSPPPPSLLSLSPCPSNSLSVTSTPFNATGNGITDDTASIQFAIDILSSLNASNALSIKYGGKALCFPGIITAPNTFLISSALIIRNNTYIIMASQYNTLLGQSQGNGFAIDGTPLLSIKSVNNVSVIGNNGNISGQKDTYATGSQRHGILIDSSTNVMISTVNINSVPGDGICLQATGMVNNVVIPNMNIMINNVNIQNACRNGIRLSSSISLSLLHSTISSTYQSVKGACNGGFFSGFNIHPNSPTDIIQKVVIDNLMTTLNPTEGILVYLQFSNEFSPPIGVSITNWSSFMDGNYTSFLSPSLGLTPRGGLRITLTNTPSNVNKSINGMVFINDSRIISPYRMGISLDNLYTQYNPLLSVNNITIINVNSGLENTSLSYQSGISYVVAGTEKPNLIEGGISFSNISVQDNRGVGGSRTAYGAYLMSNDATRMIGNISFYNFTTSGLIGSGMGNNNNTNNTVNANGGFVSFSLTNPPTNSANTGGGQGGGGTGSSSSSAFSLTTIIYIIIAVAVVLILLVICCTYRYVRNRRREKTNERSAMQMEKGKFYNSNQSQNSHFNSNNNNGEIDGRDYAKSFQSYNGFASSNSYQDSNNHSTQNLHDHNVNPSSLSNSNVVVVPSTKVSNASNSNYLAPYGNFGGNHFDRGSRSVNLFQNPAQQMAMGGGVGGEGGDNENNNKNHQRDVSFGSPYVQQDNLHPPQYLNNPPPHSHHDPNVSHHGSLSMQESFLEREREREKEQKEAEAQLSQSYELYRPQSIHVVNNKWDALLVGQRQQGNYKGKGKRNNGGGGVSSGNDNSNASLFANGGFNIQVTNENGGNRNISSYDAQHVPHDDFENGYGSANNSPRQSLNHPPPHYSPEFHASAISPTSSPHSMNSLSGNQNIPNFHLDDANGNPNNYF